MLKVIEESVINHIHTHSIMSANKDTASVAPVLATYVKSFVKDAIEDAVDEACSESLIKLESAYLAQHQNQLVELSKAFDIAKFKELKELGAKRLFISWRIWDDIVSDIEFVEFYDTTSEVKYVEGFQLPTIDDVEIYTDGFRTTRTLKPNQLYWFA